MHAYDSRMAESRVRDTISARCHPAGSAQREAVHNSAVQLMQLGLMWLAAQVPAGFCTADHRASAWLAGAVEHVRSCLH